MKCKIFQKFKNARKACEMLRFRRKESQREIDTNSVAMLLTVASVISDLTIWVMHGPETFLPHLNVLIARNAVCLEEK